MLQSIRLNESVVLRVMNFRGIVRFRQTTFYKGNKYIQPSCYTKHVNPEFRQYPVFLRKLNRLPLDSNFTHKI